MQASVLAFVLGIAFLTGAGTAAAQANPFAGVWELDRFNSVYEPITMAPERRILTLETAGDGLKSTARTWRNAVAADVTYTAGNAFSSTQIYTRAAPAS